MIRTPTRRTPSLWKQPYLYIYTYIHTYSHYITLHYITFHSIPYIHTYIHTFIHRLNIFVRSPASRQSTGAPEGMLALRRIASTNSFASCGSKNGPEACRYMRMYDIRLVKSTVHTLCVCKYICMCIHIKIDVYIYMVQR